MATKKKPVKKTAARAAKPKPASRPKARPKAGKAARPVRKKPETLRVRGVGAGLTVGDIEKSLVFYRDVLGFVEGERWMHDGKLAGIELVAGNATFWIGQDDWKKGKDRVKGIGFRLYCTTVQDVDALARQIKARGATLDQEPTSHEWGREFALTDPDGFKITFMNVKGR